MVLSVRNVRQMVSHEQTEYKLFEYDHIHDLPLIIQMYVKFNITDLRLMLTNPKI